MKFAQPIIFHDVSKTVGKTKLIEQETITNNRIHLT